MKNYLVSAAFAVAMAPLVASASDISHTWVEAGVARQTFNVPSQIGEDLDFDGGYIRGSFAINRNVYGFGSYSRVRHDNFDLDLSETQAGIGYAHALNDRTQLITELGYLGRDPNRGDDYDAARLSAGLRGQLGSRVEGWAKASYTDGNFSGGDISAQVGGMYKLAPNWGLTAEVDANDGVNSYMLGVRTSF